VLLRRERKKGRGENWKFKRAFEVTSGVMQMKTIGDRLSHREANPKSARRRRRAEAQTSHT
jgi:hypothetical protein